MSSQNSYARNVITGATANPLMPTPDEVDEAFARQANKMLLNAVEVVRAGAAASILYRAGSKGPATRRE